MEVQIIYNLTTTNVYENMGNNDIISHNEKTIAWSPSSSKCTSLLCVFQHLLSSKVIKLRRKKFIDTSLSTGGGGGGGGDWESLGEDL